MKEINVNELVEILSDWLGEEILIESVTTGTTEMKRQEVGYGGRCTIHVRAVSDEK